MPILINTNRTTDDILEELNNILIERNLTKNNDLVISYYYGALCPGDQAILKIGYEFDQDGTLGIGGIEINIFIGQSDHWAHVGAILIAENDPENPREIIAATEELLNTTSHIYD